MRVGRAAVVGIIAILGVAGPAPRAWAECGGSHDVKAQADPSATTPREIVVAVPEAAPGAPGASVVVRGGAGQGVRVVVPPSASGTAIGGDGAPGQAGAPGR